MALKARPTIKQHIIAMHGGRRGWLPRLVAALADQYGERAPSRSMVEKVIMGIKPCPRWLALELVRYLEKQPYLSDEQAAKRLGDWFYEEER